VSAPSEVREGVWRFAKPDWLPDFVASACLPLWQRRAGCCVIQEPSLAVVMHPWPRIPSAASIFAVCLPGISQGRRTAARGAPISSPSLASSIRTAGKGAGPDRMTGPRTDWGPVKKFSSCSLHTLWRRHTRRRLGVPTPEPMVEANPPSGYM